MARYRGTTAQRGLGTAHIADKKRLLAMHRDGDPCWRCGQPMYKWQSLDRDHLVDRALGGAQGPAVLAHTACNRAAGARLGNQLRPRAIMVATGRDTICAACGKPYSRAARQCEICGAHYHPNHGEQRSCSRSCGVELRRRKYGHAGTKPGKPKPPCLMCGKPCGSADNRFCSKACAGAAQTIPRQTTIAYYTCRYCGKLGVTRAYARQQREVCPARECQLARLMANNLRARNGVAKEEADRRMAAVVRSARRR